MERRESFSLEGATWSRGNMHAQGPGGPGSNPAYSSSFVVKRSQTVKNVRKADRVNVRKAAAAAIFHKA